MECAIATIAFFIFVVISSLGERRHRQAVVEHARGLHSRSAPRQQVVQQVGRRRWHAVEGAFRHLTERLHGRLVRGPAGGTPRLLFQRGTARGIVSIHDNRASGKGLPGETARYYTRVTVRAPANWPLRLEVFPSNGDPGNRYLRMQDLEVGEPEFDVRYVIRASDADLMRELLDAPTREAIDRVYRLPPFLSAVLSLNSEALVVSKLSLVADAAALEALVEGALRVYARVQEVSARLAGVELMVAAPPPDTAPVCLICGEKVEGGARIACRRCATPCHRECWRYNGRCAVFGCGEEKFDG